MDKPHVFGFGSCRVLDPLKILSDNQSIWQHHEHVKWYIHSTRDTLQKIDIIKGRKEIPNRYYDLLSPEHEKNNPVTLAPETMQKIDCFVVEISSVKSFTFDGIEVQQWCWHNLVKDACVNIKQFTDTVKQPVGKRDISFIPASTNQLVKDMATHGRLVLQDKDEIIIDLNKIECELSAPMILVPSINLPIENGSLLTDRVTISEALLSFCQTHGHTFFDPAPIIQDYGRAVALKDLGHYQPNFLYILAAHLGDAIKRTLTLKQAA